MPWKRASGTTMSNLLPCSTPEPRALVTGDIVSMNCIAPFDTLKRTSTASLLKTPSAMSAGRNVDAHRRRR